MARLGRFIFTPKLDNSSGDEWDSFDPSYSSADVEFTFLGSYLRRGDNTIALQPVEEAEEAVPDAGINYDAVELAGTDSKSQSGLESAQNCSHHFL